MARQEGSTACCPGKRAGPKGGLAERGALLASLADDMTKEVLEEVATRQWRGWGKFPALIVTSAPTVVRVPPTAPDVVERRSITLRLSAYGFDILVPLPFSRRKAAARCHALRQASTPAAATRRWTNGPGRVTYCRCGLSRKHPLNFGRHPCQPGRGAAGFGNFPVYRMAEMYLIYVEATNELGAPDAQAIDYINQLRRRAFGLPLNTVSVRDIPAGQTQASFRNIVRSERRKELAMENKRWFDLVRYGFQYAQDVLVTKQKRTNFTQTKLLFPIAQVEIINNPLLTQNPGY